MVCESCGIYENLRAKKELFKFQFAKFVHPHNFTVYSLHFDTFFPSFSSIIPTTFAFSFVFFTEPLSLMIYLCGQDNRELAGLRGLLQTSPQE